MEIERSIDPRSVRDIFLESLRKPNRLNEYILHYDRMPAHHPDNTCGWLRKSIHRMFQRDGVANNRNARLQAIKDRTEKKGADCPWTASKLNPNAQTNYAISAKGQGQGRAPPPYFILFSCLF